MIDKQIIIKQEQISDKINEIFNGTVGYGPFTGLKFSPESYWGRTDRGSMLLGLYEQEILTYISTAANSKYFIDIGAADGYYALGVLVGGLFENSICYEDSVDGRTIIQKNAKLNCVSDRVEILGRAEPGFYNHIPQEVVNNCFILVDIEGGEFDLLDEGFFSKFRKSTIVVELHDWFFSDANEKLDSFKKLSSTHHRIVELTTSSRDLSKFDELKHFTDTERWLICSERRLQLMTWFVLEPK